MSLILLKASDLELTEGRSPVSVAAASIYMASQASSDARCPAEIAAIAGQSNSFIKLSLAIKYIFHN